MMDKIGKLLYGDSERCSDLLYITGLFVPDPILWCSVDDQFFIIVSPLEYNRAKQEIKANTEVLSYGEAKKKFNLKDLRVETQIAGISKYFGITHWQVPPEFPYAPVEKLRSHPIQFTVKKSAFFPERECKNSKEIDKIQEGINLAETGLAAALETLRKSKIKSNRLLANNQPLTSERLKGIVNSTISDNGGTASHTIVACGKQGADPHNRGSGFLYPNTPIIIDIFPRVDSSGYYGDLTRTVVKGKPSQIVARAFRVVSQACEIAKKMVHSGVNGKNIHETVMKSFNENGFKSNLKTSVPYGFIHGTGHGLGLDLHESPRISRLKSILKNGHVVTIEPGLYYPDWGGIRIEDVVVVEENGHKNLTSAPIELVIP